MTTHEFAGKQQTDWVESHRPRWGLYFDAALLAVGMGNLAMLVVAPMFEAAAGRSPKVLAAWVEHQWHVFLIWEAFCAVLGLVILVLSDRTHLTASELAACEAYDWNEAGRRCLADVARRKGAFRRCHVRRAIGAHVEWMNAQASKNQDARNEEAQLSVVQVFG